MRGGSPLLQRRRLRRAYYLVTDRLRRSHRRYLLAVVGIVMLALIVSWLTHKPHPSATKAAPPSSGTITTSTDHPSEDPIRPVTYHSTATGTQPKYLRLPTIRAEGYIQAVGVDQHHQIAVPTNIHLAGWFSSAVVPGDLGLSIIDGHLDGRSGPGIFASLGQLKSGDTFTIDLANGLARKFQVKTVRSLPIADAAAALFSQTPGVSRQLNLITCGGIFKASTGYDHRVVVTAQSSDFNN